MHQDGHKVKLFLASTSEATARTKPIYEEGDDLVFGPTTRPRWSYGCPRRSMNSSPWRISPNAAASRVGRFFNVVGPRQTAHTAWFCRVSSMPRFAGRP